MRRHATQTGGLGVLKRLRADKNPVPVILLTAKSDIDDRVEGLDCGADDYLAKPIMGTYEKQKKIYLALNFSLTIAPWIAFEKYTSPL